MTGVKASDVHICYKRQKNTTHPRWRYKLCFRPRWRSDAQSFPFQLCRRHARLLEKQLKLCTLTPHHSGRESDRNACRSPGFGNYVVSVNVRSKPLFTLFFPRSHKEATLCPLRPSSSLARSGTHACTQTLAGDRHTQRSVCVLP